MYSSFHIIQLNQYFIFLNYTVHHHQFYIIPLITIILPRSIPPRLESCAVLPRFLPRKTSNPITLSFPLCSEFAFFFVFNLQGSLLEITNFLEECSVLLETMVHQSLCWGNWRLGVAQDCPRLCPMSSRNYGSTTFLSQKFG